MTGRKDVAAGLVRKKKKSTFKSAIRLSDIEQCLKQSTVVHRTYFSDKTLPLTAQELKTKFLTPENLRIFRVEEKERERKRKQPVLVISASLYRLAESDGS